MQISLFPTQSSVLSADALKERVLVDYELGDVVRCYLIARGLNDTYRVETSGGHFFLRVYRHGWRTDGETGAEMALLADLSRLGLRVSQPIVRADGGMLGYVQAAEGRRQVVLFTPAMGEDVREITTKHASAYGKLAGTLHEAMDRQLPGYDRFQLDERHLIDEPIAAIRSRMTFVEGCDEDLAFLERVAGIVRERITKLRRELPGYGLCHGDLHPGNVRFGVDGEPTLFDFDCCGYGWRAYDLSVFLWNSYLERRSARWRSSRWRAFLRGYRQVRPIGDEDLTAVPLFLVARHVWLMGLDCKGQSDWLPQWLTQGWFHSMVGYVRGWVAEWELQVE